MSPLLTITDDNGDMLMSLSVDYLTEEQQANIAAAAGEPSPHDPERQHWEAARNSAQ
jgi:hypothetical protein